MGALGYALSKKEDKAYTDLSRYTETSRPTIVEEVKRTRIIKDQSDNESDKVYYDEVDGGHYRNY